MGEWRKAGQEVRWAKWALKKLVDKNMDSQESRVQDGGRTTHRAFALGLRAPFGRLVMLSTPSLHPFLSPFRSPSVVKPVGGGGRQSHHFLE